MELASKDQSIKSKSPTDSILDETDSSSKSTESSTLSLLFDQQKSIEYFSLTSYSWCEEEWKVKIYLDFLGASSITDENIWLRCNVDELDLRVHREGVFYRFFIDALFDRVTGCVLKKKADKFILTLTKQRERIWYKIKYD